VDGQRQYPAEPDRWYGEPDEELGRVPGQRPGDSGRGGDPARYAEADRYPDDQGRYAYGEGPQYADPGYPDQGYPPAAPAEPGYADPRFADPTYDDAAVYQGGPEASPRRLPVRRRTGKRSGLDMPGQDITADTRLPEPEPADEPRGYRAERLDRQALRRPTDGGQPDMRGVDPREPGADPFGPDQVRAVEPQSPPAGLQSAGTLHGRPQNPGSQQSVPEMTSYAPLQAPTQSIQAPPAVYLSRRPGLATLLGTVAVIVELFLARVLVTAEFSHIVITNGVLGSVFAMAGTPLVAVGLYALAIGAAAAAGPNPGRAWLRTPLAYLPVGLILLFAAAIAA
jgi:hypothetical protein